MTLSYLITKLGTAKGQPKARIWIEGNRLTQAGFTPGTQYAAKWAKDHLTLTKNPSIPQREGAEMRVVSAKGKDHPIIDITGKKVVATFGEFCEAVYVHFHYGWIVIARNK